MQLGFRDNRLSRLCASDKSLRRKRGLRCAERLKQRIEDLEAVHTANELFKLPGRWHLLRADRAGQMSGDLVHPNRIIIEPAEPDCVRRADGSVDWSMVTEVVIVEIADTHG